MKTLRRFCTTALLLVAPNCVLHAQTDLVTLYKDLHQHPELSHHEERTSKVLATALSEAGYTVTQNVGVYPNGSHAFGVVGLLRNGAGPMLLVRGDMDALPIVEETGLSYSSRAMSRTDDGREAGVMHACGHDIHTTVLIGTARALAMEKREWHGTVMIVGQPSEETIDGARAMIADHLYERFGKPDIVIGLHDTNTRAAGTVAITSGPALSSATSIDVVIQGVGGHGAYPFLGRDPIVLAAEYIMQIQTIVSREEDPLSPSVVTVGSIHGGTKRNIIPDEVRLELTARAFSEKSRQVILEGLQHMAIGIGVSAGLSPERMPTVTTLEAQSAPVTYNDPALTARVKGMLVKTLGANNVFDEPPVMGSEDVVIFGIEAKCPSVYFFLGAMNPDRFAVAEAAHESLPGLHTNRFEPDPDPTLATGVRSMTAVAISLLQ